jgi:hypothetical protein
MFEQWLQSGQWTREQWLTVSILACIIAAALVIIYRLRTVFKTLNKKREPPKLRRRFRR